MKKILSKIAKKAAVIFSAVVLLLAGAGYAYYQLVYLPAQTTEEAAMQTSVVRKGDLIIYASGTGTLVSMDEIDLGFNTNGQVKTINVGVGDKVNEGDILAEMDDNNLQIKYIQAKRNLLELTSPAAVATAQEAVAAAKTDLTTAINHLSYLISPAVYYWEVEVETAKQEVAGAKAALEKSPNDAELKQKVKDAEAYLDFAEGKLKGNWYFYDHDYLRNTFTVWDKTTGTKYIAAPTADDIAEARAGLTQAKATLQEAEYLYAALTGGEVPEDATGSGLTELEQAKLDLEAAEVNLEGTKIITPISGTVMSVDMSIGDTVGTSAVITVADLSQRDLEVFLDESDWKNVQAGYEAEVVFDILPDSIFTAVVTQVDPGLYTESGSSMVRALVRLANVDSESFNLPLGTSAAVDIIAGKAEDAVLVPIEALHEAGPGRYAVFVLENGEPRLHLVEVGIQDLTYAEIISGVEAGDIVTTGIAETQ